LGARFRQDVRQALLRLRTLPLACPIERGDIRRLILSRFPYKLLHTVESDHSCILAVAHTHRAPDSWVRNLVRREGCSFFLQKADGRFYPDFLCRLPETDGQPGPVLAVEYKGADRWDAAADDRRIGDLWAELAGGRCRFVMVKD